MTNIVMEWSTVSYKLHQFVISDRNGLSLLGRLSRGINQEIKEKSRSFNIYPGLMAILRLGWRQSYFIAMIWTCVLVPFLRQRFYDWKGNDDAHVTADIAYEYGIQLDPNWLNLF